VLVGRMAMYDYANFNWLSFTNYSLTSLMLAVTLIVVSVPEGLPMSITLSLALSMRRMLKTNNLVRKLHACETMGAVTVICTDKTGTLTENVMKVAHSQIDNSCSDALLAEAVSVNSTAFIDGKTSEVLGNPTEGALLKYIIGRGFDYLSLRRDCRVVEQLPFSTLRKYMATVVDSKALNGRRVVYVKGAPEIVLEMCRQNLDDGTRARYEAQLTEYQDQAMRTIALAYAVVDSSDSLITADSLTPTPLTLMGFFAISDPVRHDVESAVALSQHAGISIKIVTGDTFRTARQVARRSGLWDDNVDSDANAVSGTTFAEMTDDEAAKIVDSIKIMYRARPTDKSRLVRLLQQNGHVVAATGDGTNDAPALHAAHVGLAMGDGTAVAKEAGDITILDNSFDSITRAVMWGRSLYRNIQRFILFQLTVNLV
ncbi:MAG: HAD-IC family P-type ATPase, partial [Muribaculaceae bacterium]|nr:HAD-IC family P-type ATPase [Muribaculaceae bacterium]